MRTSEFYLDEIWWFFIQVNWACWSWKWKLIEFFQSKQFKEKQGSNISLSTYSRVTKHCVSNAVRFCSYARVVQVPASLYFYNPYDRLNCTVNLVFVKYGGQDFGQLNLNLKIYELGSGLIKSIIIVV